MCADELTVGSQGAAGAGHRSIGSIKLSSSRRREECQLDYIHHDVGEVGADRVRGGEGASGIARQVRDGRVWQLVYVGADDVSRETGSLSGWTASRREGVGVDDVTGSGYIK